ncbi:hypothetical protein ACP70R_047038 [Stipagrostis hirtigluma subsp. patula]
MASKLAWVAMAFTMSAATAVTPCAAQSSTQDFVALHNAARAEVGVCEVA